MLTDTHAHLYWDSYKEDFDAVIQRAVDAGIFVIINIGVDIEKSQEALDQVKNTGWPKGLSVYSTIGIHPHEALRFAPLTQGKPSDVDIAVQKDMEKLEQIYLSDPEKVVAIGECGLDFYFENNPGFTPPSIPSDQVKILQKKLFQAQIDLAKKLNLPLVVHCRDDRSKNPKNSECWDEILKMIGRQLAVLHCYSGFLPTTNYILPATNLYIAFAANLTYPKNEYLREAAKIIPLERILLETDSPFLAPQSKRGQRNEPAAVAEIAQLIADLKGISSEEVARQTTTSAKKIFNI
ncbi:MAG: TatD family hydrolase [Candidatus Daviesbacteria bacterium]|nr:TatD family hydrolase [Candidatus Daviesbacteria bacterium]